MYNRRRCGIVSIIRTLEGSRKKRKLRLPIELRLFRLLPDLLIPAGRIGEIGHQCTDCNADKREKETAVKDVQKPPRCHPRNYSWSELLKRVFEIDVLECPQCGGRIRILCAINPPEAIRKILNCLGLTSRPPPAFAKASAD